MTRPPRGAPRSPRPQVYLCQRRPRATGNTSVEKITETLLPWLRAALRVEVAVVPWTSNGLVRRLGIALYLARLGGALRHITGDINFAGLLCRKRRVIVTILDCGFLAGAAGLRRACLRLVWLVLPVRRARLVVTISAFSKAEIVRHLGYDPGTIVVVPVPLAPGYREHPRTFDRDQPVFLQVGTAPNKNVDRLIEALAGLPGTLVLVGRLSAETRQLLRRHQVRFETFESCSEGELVRLYQRCDVVCFCSTYEGFGMPIIEANAVGRAVITSNLGSMPEVAADAACLVDPFDPGAIRAGLLRIVGDDAYREQLVRAGRANAARYAAAGIAATYLELYRQAGA